MDETVKIPAFNVEASRAAGSTRKRTQKDRAPKVDPLSDVPYKPTEPDTLTRRSKDSRVIEEGLTQCFVFTGMGLSMVNLYDGMVIGENATYLAQRWVKVADKNPAVRKWLLLFLEGGDWATALIGTLAVFVPIACNHMPDKVPLDMAEMVKSIGVTLPQGIAPGQTMADLMNDVASSENGNG
jgi:hypothetical protein